MGSTRQRSATARSRRAVMRRWRARNSCRSLRTPHLRQRSLRLGTSSSVRVPARERSSTRRSDVLCTLLVFLPQPEHTGRRRGSGSKMIRPLITPAGSLASCCSTGMTRGKGKYGAILRADTAFSGFEFEWDFRHLHSARLEGRCPTHFCLLNPRIRCTQIRDEP